MDPATEAILKHFEWAHLPPYLHWASEPFYELAHMVATSLDGPEAMTCLRKLLEAKDCAVRAAL